MQKISRKDALQQGLKRYFTGLPCKYGHVAERRTCDWTCTECGKDHGKKDYHRRRDKILTQKKEYRDANKERVLERQRDHYRRNREQVKEKTRLYKEQNPDKVAASSAKRRASELNATPNWLTEAHLEEMREIYTLRNKLTEETGVEHHTDHIIPLQGENVSGLHVPWNLRVITAVENLSKGNSFDPSAAPPGATLH